MTYLSTIVIVWLVYTLFGSNVTYGNLPIPQPMPVQPQSMEYDVPENLNLRDTALDITDYGCGTFGFCNKTLARYPDQHCFKCPDCYCDDQCFQYGDCCPDILFNSSDTVVPASPYISCEKKYIKWAGLPEEAHIFVVSRCPPEFQGDLSLKRRCEEPIKYNLEEATYVSAGNITYRNKYCAMCNNQLGYTIWQREVQCRETEFLKSAKDKAELWRLVLDNPKCKITPQVPSNVKSRKCQGAIIDKCNITQNWFKPDNRSEELCGLYYAPVSTGVKSWYKNIFCAVCNGVKLSRSAQCADSGIVSPYEPNYPLSVLIDFNPKPQLFSAPVFQPEIRAKCNTSSLFDPFSETCVTARCSFGRILWDGVCDLTFKFAKGLGYSGSMTLEYPDELSMEQWRELMDLVNDELRKSLRSYEILFLPEFGYTFYLTYDFEVLPSGPVMHERVLGARFSFTFVSLTYADQMSLEQDLRRSLELEITFLNKTVKTRPVECPNVPVAMEPHVRLLSEISRQPIICTDFCDERVLEFTPILSILECPFVEFNITNQTFTFDKLNSTIEVGNNTVYLDTYDYWQCGELLRICGRALSQIEDVLKKDDSRENTTEAQPIPRGSAFPIEMAIVSTVCIALSLFCLLMTFLLYVLVPSLRTLPGKNTMILVAYLFGSQLLFQVGIGLSNDQALCKAMGILIHYLWVATFTSMGICAYHMYSVFTSMSRSTSTDDCKTLTVYLLIIHLVPAVVVGVCIGYHAGLSQGVDIGYGGSICFLRLPMDIGIFFAGPLGIVLVFNTVCFVKVILAIRHVPDMGSSKNKSNKTHLNVYFRLSVLLGFTWIFGFIAAASQYQFFWYVFVIFTGLQGVFIFVAYCVNRRTWGLVQETFHCTPKQKYKPSGQSSSPVPSTVTSSM